MRNKAPIFNPRIFQFAGGRFGTANARRPHSKEKFDRPSIFVARKLGPHFVRLLAAFFLMFTAANVSFSADWPQWGGRQMRNMYSPEKGLPDSFGKIDFKPGTEDIDTKSVKNLRWASKIGSQSYGNVTVGNGKVYLATFSNRVNIYGLLPAININLAGSNVVLTWSTNNSLNYGMQSTTNLLSGTNAWKDITNAATVTNGLYRLTAPVTNKVTFYRLKSN